MARNPKQYEASDEQSVDPAGGAAAGKDAVSEKLDDKSRTWADSGSDVSDAKPSVQKQAAADDTASARSKNKTVLKKRPGEKPFPIIRKPVPISKSGPLKAPGQGASAKEREKDRDHPVLTRKVETGVPGKPVRPEQNGKDKAADKRSETTPETAAKTGPARSVEQQASELDFLDLDDGASWVSGSEDPSDFTAEHVVPESALARWTRMGALVAVLLGTATLAYMLLPQWIERRSDLDSQIAAGSQPESSPGIEVNNSISAGNNSTAGILDPVGPQVPGSTTNPVPDGPDGNSVVQTQGPVVDNDDPSLPLNVRFRNKLEHLDSLVASGDTASAASLLANMDRTLYGYGAPEFGSLESQILQQTGAGSLAELTPDLPTIPAINRQTDLSDNPGTQEQQQASNQLADQLADLREGQNQAGSNLPADAGQQAQLPQQSRVQEEQEALIAAQEQAARELELQQAELRRAEEQAARTLAEQQDAQLLAEEQAALELAERQAAELLAQELEAQELAQRQEAQRLAEEQAARELAARQQEQRQAEEREALRLAGEQAAQELAAQREAQRLAEEREAERLVQEQAARELAAQREAQRLAEESEAERLAQEQAARELAAQREARQQQQESRQLAQQSTPQASQGPTGNSASERSAAQQQAEIELASQRATQRIAAEQAVRELARQQNRETTLAMAEPPMVNSIQSVEPVSGTQALTQSIADTISDQERQLVYERFGRLQKAIRDRDIQEVIALTDRSVSKIQQFQQMFQNNVSIDARIKNVSIRDADGEIQGTLVITRLERADGVVTGPPLNLASVTLTSRRNQDGWSLISW